MSKLTEVLKLFCYDPETDGNLTFNVTEALTKNWEKIDQLVLLAVAAAAAYDPEGSYAVGDYCTYGGGLQKCNTAIDGGEPWNAAHWTATTVAAELAEVRTSLSNKVGYQANIQSGDDINNLTNTGIYRLLSGSYASQVDNLPPDYGAKAGVLIVLHTLQLMASFGDADKTVSVLWMRDFYVVNGETRWTGWVRVSGATPPKVRNLPLQSGFTADGGCAFWKTQESVVTVAGGVSGTLPGNKDTQIGVLQEGFRPTESRRYDATTNVGAAVLEIRMDGTVWMHPHEDAALCWFSAEFVTE